MHCRAGLVLAGALRAVNDTTVNQAQHARLSVNMTEPRIAIACDSIPTIGNNGSNHIMHTFIKNNGDVFRCERFMQGPSLKPGYEWRSTNDQNWTECPMMPTFDINDKRLFGYRESDFLAKQYKE